MVKSLSSILLALVLLGCASTATLQPGPDTQQPRAVLLITGAVPPSVQYDTLGDLRVRIPPFGNVAAFQKARAKLAAEAHQRGANAVIHVQTVYKWTLAGWTTFGSGTAIRLPDGIAEQIAAMPHVQAEWR